MSLDNYEGCSDQQQAGGSRGRGSGRWFMVLSFWFARSLTTVCPSPATDQGVFECFKRRGHVIFMVPPDLLEDLLFVTPAPTCKARVCGFMLRFTQSTDFIVSNPALYPGGG